jgi:hypothetical protein
MIYFPGFFFRRLAGWCNLKYMERCHSCANNRFYASHLQIYPKHEISQNIFILAKLSHLNLLHFLTPYLFYTKMKGYQPFMSILSSCLFTQIFHRSPWPTTNEFLAPLLCKLTLHFLPLDLTSLWSARCWLLCFLTDANITNYDALFAKCSASIAFLSKFHLFSITMI